MRATSDIFGSFCKNGSAVLMARIVDGAGRHVRRSEVRTITYSVLGPDACRPGHLKAVAGHSEVPLSVSAVMCKSLQTSDSWTVDDVGYNFRHEIDVSRHEAFPEAGALYQVCYEFTPTSGQKTIVRFQLRVI